MTISWGSVGIYWGKPVDDGPGAPFALHEGLIEHSGVFTVSIPKEGELSKELAFCGTKSGRDVDKFAACGLTARPGRTLPAPVVGEAWMHMECRVVSKDAHGCESFVPDIDQQALSGKELPRAVPR